MSKYIIRLDDASEYMDTYKWNRIEAVLDKHNIKPIFGIIPDNQDESLVRRYTFNPQFWELMRIWVNKGWIPALHGYQHKYITNEGGINPVNYRSEFAGVPYAEQAEKIGNGWRILLEHGIKPIVFFAPSHTFDRETLNAIKNMTEIRIISDTIAWDVYKEDEFWFVPQQSGKARRLPFGTVTLCYHPNEMNDKDFHQLDTFIGKNRFTTFSTNMLTNRTYGVIDEALRCLYYARRRSLKHS